MRYSEPTRRAVAFALGWIQDSDDWWHAPSDRPADMSQDSPTCTPADLEALNRLAAEAQGWVLDNDTGMWLDAGCTIDDAGSIMGGLETYTPATDDAQAIALCDAVGWTLAGEVIAEIVGPKVLRPGWIDGVAFAMNNHPEDRPALLTAAAVIAARESTQTTKEEGTP